MKIAIQGHPTRGKEIIQILESLGGKKLYYSDASDKYLVFFINDKGHISCLNRKNPTVKEYRKIYTLEEFEKEFPFKVGDKVIDYEGDVATITGFAYIEENLGYSLQYENGRGTATPGILTPYKEMKEERNITLTLEKAKEWYKKGGELKEVALQAFTEKELNPLPRSWEEFCNTHSTITDNEYFIDYDSNICKVNGKKIRVYTSDRNIYPSQKSAEAHLALIQLEQLRNCWWNGWEPEWKSYAKYSIKNSNDGLSVIISYNVAAFLTFPTIEMAEEFLECFKDLIEQAGDLI